MTEAREIIIFDDEIDYTLHVNGRSTAFHHDFDSFKVACLKHISEAEFEAAWLNRAKEGAQWPATTRSAYRDEGLDDQGFNDSVLGK